VCFITHACTYIGVQVKAMAREVWPAWSGVDGFTVVSLLCKTELYIVYRIFLASVGRCCTATGMNGGLLTSKQT
jgi:predicted membrane-bound dolichyl-phosphate-mannose-protein mannosyltransferase